MNRHQAPASQVENSVIIPPVFLAPGAVVRNSVVGPNVSVGSGTTLDQCILSNSIINDHSRLSLVTAKDSIVGRNVSVEGPIRKLNVGDHTDIIN